MRWRNIGPARGGRSVAVTGVPGQPLVYYMGVTGGGVWKTVDAGNTWKPIADKHLKTGSVGAIAVADSDPNVVYVGMGESCVRGNFSHGDGVYRSNDAGKTWTHVGLGDTRQIGRIRIHPKDADLVYVAALGHIFGTNEQRGVFRSRDGGGNWERVLYVDEKTAAVDLAMDPTNPRVLYAAFWQVSRTPYALTSGGPGSGLYKSTDGGDTWDQLTEGLPEGIKGRIGVAVSPVTPERVWAIVEAEEGGIFRSEDGGKKWRKINEDRRWRQRAWYYTHIYADTQDADRVYVLNTALARSTDGGKSFTTIGVPHADNHDLWIAPEDNQRMINANDGGSNVTFNGGASWSRQDNQPTAQFYHVATDNQFPYRVYGAQQDNSTVSISSRASADRRPDFYSVGGGESGYIAPHPKDHNIVYAGSYGGYLSRYDHHIRKRRNITVWPENPMGWGVADIKYRFQWTFPIVISPHDDNVIYVGGNVLFKSTNQGQSWEVISPDLTTNDKSKQGPSGGPITHDNTGVEYYCTIFALVESPHEPGTLWVGSDDGLVHITRDGGATWNNVTPPDLPQWGMVSMIEVSPHDPATGYLAVNAYKLDDFKPYIFKTTDYGKTWSQIAKGIPADAFVRVVREDPKRPGLLYAGTETGVFVSFDDGQHWQSLQLKLPVVPITDLVVKENDLVVATQGRSFWILDDLTQLHQLCDEMASATYLLKPRKSYLSVDRGVMINYRLAEEPEEEVTVEILDADGELIKSFSSKKKKDDQDDKKDESPSSPGPDERDQPSTQTVLVREGMSRFLWDMRYPDATKVKGAVMWGGSIRGPLAPPGQYQIRLTVGETGLTQPFEIVKDPRVTATQEDYQKRFELLLTVHEKVSQTHDAINHIRTVKRQIKEATQRAKKHSDGENVETAGKELAEKLTAIEEELIQTKSKSSQDPLNYPIKLNNKLAAMSGVISRSDFAPTDQAYAVFDELSKQLKVQLDALDVILETDVTAFNRLIQEEAVPAITAFKPKKDGVDGGSQESVSPPRGNDSP